MSTEKIKLDVLESQCKPFDVLKSYTAVPFHSKSLQLYTCTSCTAMMIAMLNKQGSGK